MKRGLPQYRSLYEYDGGSEVDPDDWLRCTRPQRIVAHLAFDPARHPPPPAAHHALLQDLVQYRLMQGEPGRRGKVQQTAAACGGRPAPRAERRAGPGPHRPAAPPRASARAPRNAPAAGPRTPAGPVPGSYCAARPAPRADASLIRQGRLRSPSARDRARPIPPRAPWPDRRSWSPTDRAARLRPRPPAGTPPRDTARPQSRDTRPFRPG